MAHPPDVLEKRIPLPLLWARATPEFKVLTSPTPQKKRRGNITKDFFVILRQKILRIKFHLPLNSEYVPDYPPFKVSLALIQDSVDKNKKNKI